MTMRKPPSSESKAAKRRRSGPIASPASATARTRAHKCTEPPRSREVAVVPTPVEAVIKFLHYFLCLDYIQYMCSRIYLLISGQNLLKNLKYLIAAMFLIRLPTAVGHVLMHMSHVQYISKEKPLAIRIAAMFLICFVLISIFFFMCRIIVIMSMKRMSLIWMMKCLRKAYLHM